MKGMFKPVAPKGAPAKQVTSEMLPSRSSLSALTGGSSFERSANNYAKQTPADASGKKSAGLNITMGGPYGPMRGK